MTNAKRYKIVIYWVSCGAHAEQRVETYESYDAACRFLDRLGKGGGVHADTSSALMSSNPVRKRL